MFEIEKNKVIVDKLIKYMNDNKDEKGILMATLLKAQELIGYIPRDIVVLIEEELGAPISRIDGIIQYYAFLTDQAVEYKEMQEKYVSSINKKYTIKDIEGITNKAISSLSNFKDINEYITNGGFKALANTLMKSSTSTIQTIKDSGFKGRGDGGFVTGLKWELVSSIIEFNNKAVICNADINNNPLDSKIVKDNPFKLIEGIIIAGYSIGVNKGYIYTSHTKEMERAIKDAYAAGILGKKILGTDFYFDIEIRFSDDNFISPREVETDKFIERDINIHRNKDINDRAFGVSGKPLEYYITEKCIGCTKCAKNCPVSCIESEPKKLHIIDPKACIKCGTCMYVCPVSAIVYTNLIANVETLINVTDVLNVGAEDYKTIGNPKNPGMKIISLEGDINTPQMIEVPTELTIKEIIETYSGGVIGDLLGVRIGGPIGPILTLDKIEKPIDLDTPTKYGLISGVMEGISIYVVAGKTSMMDLAKQSME